MNTLMDIRESFFKNRVTSLMSRPAIIKILNRPMNKKSNSNTVVYEASPKLQKKDKKQDNNNSQSPRKLDVQKQLQLKQKKQSLQMRLAYSAEQNNPDALKKMMAAHSQKQIFLTQKIDKIVDSHQDRLKKRLSQRKQRVLTVKAKSQINQQIQSNEISFNGSDNFQYHSKDISPVKITSHDILTNQLKSSQIKKQINQQQNQSHNKDKNHKVKKTQKHRSLSPRKFKTIQNQKEEKLIQGLSQRKISQDLTKEVTITKQQIIEFIKNQKNKTQDPDPCIKPEQK